MKQTTLIILLFFAIQAFSQNVPIISSISSDPIVKEIRQSVHDEMNSIRYQKDASLLPSLSFYKYTLVKGDTFWKIVSMTALNVDTLMSVNRLTSPYDLNPGDSIFVPNMRGVIHETAENETIDSIEKKYAINREFIFSANKSTGISKRFLFIPCGEVSSLERSLFLGTGFAAPLMHLRRTSGFGVRRDPITGERAFHSGVDLGCNIGTPIYATRTGKVIFAGYSGNYGKLIIIQHPYGYYSYYGHLSKIMVKCGTIVNENILIGKSGNTGRTTGPHLHFEIRKNKKAVNPVILNR